MRKTWSHLDPSWKFVPCFARMLPITRTTHFTIRPILHVNMKRGIHGAKKKMGHTNFVVGASNSTAPNVLFNEE